LTVLSKELTRELGRGFSRSNIANMRLFFLTYPIVQSVIGQLSWTHYLQLISIKDPDARSFYEHEASNAVSCIKFIYEKGNLYRKGDF
jgi:hypothetical protein